MPAETGRLRAEIIPVVTVEAKPSGEPIAMTGSPTTNLVESPKLSAARLPLFIFSTATS